MKKTSVHTKTAPRSPGIRLRPDKKSETRDALVKERDLLRLLLDELPDNIYVKDCAGRYVIDNRAHRKFLGAKTEQNVAGKSVFDFFPRALAQKYDEDDKRVIASGKPLLNREEPITDASGTDKWVATSKIPELDRKGTVSRLVCISRDITDRKRYQDALEKTKAELETRVNERTAELKSANERLREQIKLLKEKARLDAELEAARTIQQRLTPSFKPKIPRVNLMGSYLPAYEVGGDYLDYFQNEAGNWVIAIADVCGKGIPAALLMTMLRSTFRASARRETSARELLCSVNDSLTATIDHRSFITALCLIISSDGNSMSYARAGHPPLLRLGAGGGPPKDMKSEGLALGLAPDNATFRSGLEETVIRLDIGDRFFMYTDGLMDAEGRDKECFGQERICALLASLQGVDAEGLVSQVMERIRQFAGGVPYRDDMTMCALNVTGAD
ncbi:MAG TPA: PP2C family protein-serine/threonine phosphatase [Chitinivibrionales bacterium]|jgi:sigma-B regulation protein RsbU (phosphoserine phosphatase)|nr:PP2C family protein-serine/threonine phosphatase [Chitinivibrionales bacterium]